MIKKLFVSAEHIYFQHWPINSALTSHTNHAPLLWHPRRRLDATAGILTCAEVLKSP